MREAIDAFEETGAAGRAGWATVCLGSVELQRGNDARAEATFREAVRLLGTTQEQGFLVEAERGLAEALVRVGKLGEAERVAEHALRTVGREDVWSRASTLHAIGLVRVAQGRTEEAEALLRESLAIIEPTMYAVLADEVRSSLDGLHHGAAALPR